MLSCVEYEKSFITSWSGTIIAVGGIEATSCFVASVVVISNKIQ